MPSETSLKQRIVLWLIPAARSVMEGVPQLRATVWNNALQGRLEYRDFPFIKPAHFGATFAGNTADVIQRYIYFFGCWEPQVEAVISRSLGPGDTFIDVGANIGYFSLLAAKRVGQTGRVYAFEASANTFRKLRENITRNGLESVVHATHAAVADRAGTLVLYAGPEDNCGMSSLIRNEGGTEETVDSQPLASLLPEQALTEARLIKIDVEGAEDLVLAGLEPDLGKVRADILMEMNPELAAMPRLWEMLERSGRSAYEILPSDSIDNYFKAPLPAMVKLLKSAPARRSDVLFTSRSVADMAALGIRCVPSA